MCHNYIIYTLYYCITISNLLVWNSYNACLLCIDQATCKERDDASFSSERLPLLADMVLYYCRHADQPVLLQLYQAEVIHGAHTRALIYTSSLWINVICKHTLGHTHTYAHTRNKCGVYVHTADPGWRGKEDRSVYSFSGARPHCWNQSC